jgi:hypothetical protein
MGSRKEMKGSYQALNYDVYLRFQTFWQVPDLFSRQWLLVRSGPGLQYPLLNVFTSVFALGLPSVTYFGFRY